MAPFVFRPAKLFSSVCSLTLTAAPSTNREPAPSANSSVQISKEQFQDEVSFSRSDWTPCRISLVWKFVHYRWNHSLHIVHSGTHAKNNFGRIRAIISSYCQCVSRLRWQQQHCEHWCYTVWHRRRRWSFAKWPPFHCSKLLITAGNSHYRYQSIAICIYCSVYLHIYRFATLYYFVCLSLSTRTNWCYQYVHCLINSGHLIISPPSVAAFANLIIRCPLLSFPLRIYFTVDLIAPR